MPRFNVTASPVLRSGTQVQNYAGGQAYQESSELELVSLLLTSFVKDQFYRSANDTLDRLKALLDKTPPLFAAKAAVYTRDRFGMRSISHVVAGELAYRAKKQSWMRPFLRSVVVRVDDITEILSYYMSTYGKRPIANSLKDGLALAFGQFNEYQLAKYQMEGKGLSLVDTVNLLHPKPTEKNAEALRKLMKGELRAEDTWETGLSAAGKAEDMGQAKAAVWQGLLAEKKLGYFALLRNLRNIAAQAPEALPLALSQLTDREHIHKSRVLPFRFQAAIKKLTAEATPRSVIVALSKALDLAVDNVPSLPGKTLIAIDHSGSMASGGTTQTPIEIASLFGAILYKSQDADLLLFSDVAAWLTPNPLDSVTSISVHIKNSMESRGTDFHSIFQLAQKPYARIIILSDMQAWMTSADGYFNVGGNPAASFADYKGRSGAKPHVYSWDLAGLGTLQFPEERVYALAGFSEKVFDLMALLEQDKQALLNTIEAVQFGNPIRDAEADM